jgi:hypothetical protein
MSLCFRIRYCFSKALTYNMRKALAELHDHPNLYSWNNKPHIESWMGRLKLLRDGIEHGIEIFERLNSIKLEKL